MRVFPDLEFFNLFSEVLVSFLRILVRVEGKVPGIVESNFARYNFRAILALE